MPLVDGVPLTFRPSGLSDAVDGSNAFQGAMSSLQNLIPNPSTKKQWVPRPASQELVNIADTYTSATTISALIVQGTRAYGMIASSAFTGKDQPFCYDIENDVMVTISGQASVNLPNTLSASGDWQPPKMQQVGGRILVTHTGFTGTASYFGWIDISSFSLSTLTGATHTNTTIDGLSTNPLTLGVEVGMNISGANIPANTTITAITATSFTISQPATGSSGGVALTITGGTFAAPQWGSGNTNTVALPSVPNSVGAFNNRAWYAVDNYVYYSDALYPTQITNANQALLIGDNLDVTALAGLPLSNVLGGIVGSLIAFKGDAIMYQIKGDSTSNDLTVNSLNITVGTLAPNTIAPTPLGLAFISGDGMRILTFSGIITGVFGSNGDGVNVPFINAVTPSRMVASYNQNVYRVSVKNGAAAGNPWEEYWYDFSQKIFHGPHSFPAAMIAPFHGATNHGFIIAAVAISAKLWNGPATPDVSSTYTENGAALSWIYQTVLLPDTDTMRMNGVSLTTIGIALPSTLSITVQALDEQGNVLDTVTVTGSGVAPFLWGTGIWGSAIWGTSGAMFQQVLVPWTTNLNFKQMTFRATGASVTDFVIGNIYFEYQRLNYLLGAS